MASASCRTPEGAQAARARADAHAGKSTRKNRGVVPPSAAGIKTSACESTNRFEKHGIVRRLLELRLPHIASARALALGPQDLSQMGGDLRIRTLRERAAQKFLR